MFGETMRMATFRNLVICSVLRLMSCVEGGLKLDFYHESCPKAEKLVLYFVKEHIQNAPALATPLLRMHFHNCIVRGCDASVLINSTSPNKVEKAAIPNLTLCGFDFIDRVKSVVETECLRIVTCTDIIALVARDSVGVLARSSQLFIRTMLTFFLVFLYVHKHL